MLKGNACARDATNTNEKKDQNQTALRRAPATWTFVLELVVMELATDSAYCRSCGGIVLLSSVVV